LLRFYQYNDDDLIDNLTVTTLDLTLLPLYRLNNKELPALPGLLAMTPPRKTARGREHDRLIVYLVLTGNATLSTVEYLQLTSQTASRFFETSGALTTAMRASVETLNRTLLDRNMSSTGRGQYALGALVLAALRGTQCTLLLSGPTHVYTLGSGTMQHIHDPALSGKGLGLSQAATSYFSQTEMHPGDRLVFSSKPPEGWEKVLSEELRPSSIDAIRRRLLSTTKDNVNAILIRVGDEGEGLSLLRPTPSQDRKPGESASSNPPPTVTEGLPPSNQPETALEPEEGLPEEPAPEFTPSAYGIPPQPEEEELPEIEGVIPQFPASIPRATPTEPEAPSLREMDEPIMEEPEEPPEPRQPSEATRQVARGLVGGMQASRRMSAAFSRNLSKFLPNLLPGNDGFSSSTMSSNALLLFIAVAVPMVVVTVGLVMYSRFGRNIQYDANMQQAEEARTRAVSASTPARQRTEWQAVMGYLREAEKARTTPELENFRQEAQNELDTLEGIQRLTFYPAFGSGVSAQISRLAANETDLYMLDAERGRVLRASLVGRNFELDQAFRCDSGEYGEYQVGPIVDIMILPRLNVLDAAVVGVDAGGQLLYCAPGQVPQAVPLPLPNAKQGRVTGFALSSWGYLYILDASERSIWVYAGQDASFLEPPSFFFGGQIPEIEDAIDLAVGDEHIYLLHADGHLSICEYKNPEGPPTNCQDPAELTHSLQAFQDIDLFAQTHITQIMLTTLPDSTLLLLNADNRSVLRISPGGLTLRDQIYPTPGTSMMSGAAGAMTVNLNRVLFLAIDDQVYFAADMP